ncbi:MAG: HK97 gp10 family phage protein [Porphyrobacter sp.]|nr:HK97 gp10 family phage protein [Porphyrobacter sp.]
MPKRVKIEGFRELEAALADLPKATGKNVLRRVLKKAADPIERDAAANAPVRTGKLRDDVKTGTRLTRRQAAQQRKLGKSEVEVHVGVANPAGLQTEFGNAHQPAQPWMRPAWDANKEGALATIGSELGTEIKKAADRVARKAAKRAG